VSERNTHKFQFSASAIACAAAAEAEYHEGRIAHWRARSDKALAVVKDTIGAKVVEHQMTGGTAVSIDVDYGEPAAWREYQLAHGKAKSHTEAAERYRTDERVYATQGDRAYDLDTDDVHHFRLGGQGRED
jgi:hypothetical protein